MGKDKDKDKVQYQLKTPKGTKDWDGKDMVIRDKIFTDITKVFKRHGAVTIDTPVFERKEILSGKYGEDSKLIYDLKDQGGELCSLRYDLTVPFARWLAMNPAVQNIKRYHLAKVYRRDQPAVKKGRMREFYQCDFDIAGNYDPMLPDAEILRITTEVFAELGWKERYTIKINHRKLLDGIFQICDVPPGKLRAISSAVDKLDKAPWTEVRREMVEEKGLPEPVADAVGGFVCQHGLRDLLSTLQANSDLQSNAAAKKGLEDMELLFGYLEAFDVLDKVSLDLSLARGLDYYTGVIYEVVTEGSAPSTAGSNEGQAHRAKRRPPKSAPAKADAQGGASSTSADAASKNEDDDEDRSSDPSIGVGSIAAGGRYDDLVGMFSGKGQIPCVGISFGLDRIFSLTKSRLSSSSVTSSAPKIRSTEVEAYVMAFGGKGFDGMLAARMAIAKRLWDGGIKTEFSYKVKPKLPAQFKAAEADDVPFAVILGESEQANGEVRVKELGLPEGHPEKDGVLVAIESLVSEVRRRLTRKQSLAEESGEKEGERQQEEGVVGGWVRGRQEQEGDQQHAKVQQKMDALTVQ